MSRFLIHERLVEAGWRLKGVAYDTSSPDYNNQMATWGKEVKRGLDRGEFREARAFPLFYVVYGEGTPDNPRRPQMYVYYIRS